MTDQERLEELLNRWEDLRDRERDVSDEALCRDCPELLAEFRRRVADLKRIDGFLRYGLNEAEEEEDELTAAGRYRPLQLRAHGGLGEVFMARDEELGREVALKRMRWLEAADPQRARHFQFEAEITGRLDHPGVVPVYGLGCDAKGRLYYAMRFVQGDNLQQAIDQFHRVYPPGRGHVGRGNALHKLIRRFLTVCETIAYAHSQDVIHRDLKPANIMLGPYGETLVVDWGLAKRLPKRVDPGAATLEMAKAAETTAADQTMLGQIKGSPAYMSPEQAEGRTDLIGPQSDIYGLGATLYTILTGKLPFADMALHQLLDHVKRGDFPRPSQIRGDVAPALEAVCLKAMRLKPGDRYATALELAADLEHWLADDAVSAWREPWTLRAKRWMRKHQTLTSTVVAAVLVALLGISAVAVQQRQSNQALGEKNAQLVVANQNESDQRKKAESLEKMARDAAEQARLAAKKAQDSEQKARRELYSFLILSAERALQAGDRGFAEDALDQCPEDLRNVEWRLLYRRTTASRQTWRITRAWGSVPSIALGNDGTRLAAADPKGPVQVLNAADGKLLAKLAGPADKVAFLPDGDHLLLMPLGILSPANRGPVELWSIKQNKRVAQLFPPDVDRFVLSGDGQRVALIGVMMWPGPRGELKEVSSRIHVCEALSGKLVALIDGIPGRVADAAFSPNHERLYAIVRQVNVKPEWRFANLFMHGDPGPRRFTLADSGPSRFQLQAWNVTASRELKVLKPIFSKDGPEEADAVAMTVSPDGEQILVSDRNQRTVPTGPAESRPTKGRIIVFDAATGETVRADGYDLGSPAPAARVNRPLDFTGFLDHAGSLAISPDGKRLAVACGKRIAVFERKSGKRLAELAGHLAPPQCLVFGRDGNELYSAGGEDGRVKQWSLSLSSTDRIVLPSGYEPTRREAAFSRDSRHMAVAAVDGRIEIFAVATGRPWMTVPPISSAVAQDKLREANRLFPLEENATPPSRYRALDMRFSPDGKRLTAIYCDRLVCVWDISGEKPVVVDFIDALALNKDQKLQSFTHPLLLSPDGGYLASDSHHGMNRCFRVWEVEHRRMIVSHENDKFLDTTPTMAFAENSRTFCLERKSPIAEPPVLAWDLAAGKPTELPGITHLVDPDVDSLDQVSPDGSRLLRTVDGVIKIEDRQTGRALLEHGDRDPYFWATFSPDGNYILARKSNGAELLDASPIGQPAEKP
jgi:serine/threonine protein kinase/WD40 repeat protein